MYFLSHAGQSEAYLFTSDNQFLGTFATKDYAQSFIDWAFTVTDQDVNWRLYQFNSEFTMQEKEAFLDEEARHFRLLEKGVVLGWVPAMEGFAGFYPVSQLCCLLY